MLFILDSPSVVKSLVTVHLIFLWFYSIFLIVIELTTPSTLLPIHVQQTNEKQTDGSSACSSCRGCPEASSSPS